MDVPPDVTAKDISLLSDYRLQSVLLCLTAHGVNVSHTDQVSEISTVPYTALNAVSKMFMMRTGQQHAPWGCDHHKE